MAPRSGFAGFIDAVAKMNHDINPDCRIANDAKQLIGLHVHGLIKDICTRVSEVTADKSRVEYTDIISVLSSFFTGEFLALAHDEGSRRLYLHSIGMLPFNPKKPPKSGHKKEDTALLNIMKVAVGNFIASKSNIMGIESFDEGCIKIATIMFHIAKFLQSALSDISREENLLEVDENHVQRALGDALAKNLQEHAIHHSKVNVEKYIKGEYKYDVTETISKLIPPVPMKKTTPKRKKVSPTPKRATKRKATSASKKSKKAPTARKKVKAAKKTTAPKKSVKRKAPSSSAPSKKRATKTAPVSTKTKKSAAPKPRKTAKRKTASPAASSKKKVRKTAPASQRKKKSTRTAPKVKKPAKKMVAPPPKSVPRKELEKEPSPEDIRGRPDFAKGVLELFNKKEKQPIPENTPGIEEINSSIGDVCDSLIEELNRQNHPLSVENLRVAVESLLPANMAQHALSNAGQALVVPSSLSSSA